MTGILVTEGIGTNFNQRFEIEKDLATGKASFGIREYEVRRVL